MRALLSYPGRGHPEQGASGVRETRVPLAIIIDTNFDGCLFCAALIPLFNPQPNEGRNTIVFPILQVKKMMHKEVKCLPKDTEQVGGRVGL